VSELRIDGSFGEGGGQILRTSLALALHLRRPLHLVNIRAHRQPPGLRRQHLACVLAATEISGGHVEGARLGSQEIRFEPGPLRPGHYTFDIGTAGSTTLLLQTLLPPLLLASAPSRLTLKGGTHNPHAPPFDFLDQVLLPLLQRMGAQVKLKLVRPGFYPKGGGVLEAAIEPVARLNPLALDQRGEVLDIHARAVVAGLPRHIAARELGVLAQRLELTNGALAIEEWHDCGIGNVVTTRIHCRHITELFTGFGEKGVPAETVASRLADEVETYLAADVPVGPYLADQLLVPLALAGSGRFLTLSPTRHTTTNIWIIEQCLPLCFQVEREGERCWIHLAHQ